MGKYPGCRSRISRNQVTGSPPGTFEQLFIGSKSIHLFGKVTGCNNLNAAAAGFQLLCLLELAVMRTKEHRNAIHRSLEHIVDSDTETTAHLSHCAITVNR